MIDYKNSEGYPDPTAYEALKNIEGHYYKMVYICSPYAGEVELNSAKARIYSRFAISQGYMPITPHLLYPQFLSEEKERYIGLKFGNILLDRCEEVWVFGDKPSKGMVAEIARAKRRKILIRYFNINCQEVKRV